ncbi:Putative peptidoglycan binding domain-containing protein [Jatrophihabitans endophyticus]|uniref:Putative peptidoglycan binding domain-containing protein n=1 Tax=Jatrophihabitans endophyticus TaxID=1206085 RepID=A0A1M5HND6_9ACTN|nr:peptidoglycan-binding domain-containing protein [Jatrophihabitans endophyticus]SHG17437.1 Putative peptidoglycan binding domain-containing protein [Jatrophihabitans endophyticus]
MPRPLSRLCALVATTLAALALLVAPTAAQAATRAPRTPSGLPATIEPMAGYSGQVACDPRTRPGTRKLATLLAATYSAGRSWNTTYACGTDGSRSEHYDGRAIDWMVSIRNKAQHAAAKAAIAWLLATDKAGNRFAMARRLGVMYLIYDNRMWGAWSGRWEDYNGCGKLPSRANDNWCHRTHVHISLSWNGAMGRTTFWTKRVYATDYGPCRYQGMNWAPMYRKRNLSGCQNYASVKAPRKSSSTKKALVAYSGATLRRGLTGPAVTALQTALHVRATGHYTGATVAAVRRFQAKHHLGRSGVMWTRTWRALLAAVK